MENITLTHSQIATILNALLAVERSGGGSHEFHLRRKLEEISGIEACPVAATHYQQIARSELEDV